MMKAAKDRGYIKTFNRCLILKCILRESMSRSELSLKTGLTRAAVSFIAGNMIEEGIIVETGKTDTAIGRKPIMLDINPDGGYVFGIDINRKGCYIGLVDFKGNLRDKDEFLLDRVGSTEEALKRIAGSIERMIPANKIEKCKVKGIGISAPGPLDVYGGIILNPPNFDLWHGVKIYDFFKERFPYSVCLENNANAYALYEKNYGNAVNFGNFVLIAVTTGVGAGIVINQKLYRGADGFGSEIGHMSIDYKGPLCSCGNKGCLELFTSVPAILEYAASKGTEVSSWEEIADRAAAGDAKCLALVRREARFLAIGIVNFINLMETEAVVLSGDISYRPRQITDMIKEDIAAFSITRRLHSVSVIGANVIKDLNIVAAASIIFDRYFHN